MVAAGDADPGGRWQNVFARKIKRTNKNIAAAPTACPTFPLALTYLKINLTAFLLRCFSTKQDIISHCLLLCSCCISYACGSAWWLLLFDTKIVILK